MSRKLVLLRDGWIDCGGDGKMRQPLVRFSASLIIAWPSECDDYSTGAKRVDDRPEIVKHRQQCRKSNSEWNVMYTVMAREATIVCRILL